MPLEKATTPPGLSTPQALQQQLRDGFNDIEVDGAGQHSLLSTLRGVVREPMFLLLLVAATLYLVIGELGEGLLLAFFALVTVGLVVLQERRSEHALDALRALAAPQVRVLRDGQVQRIAARELVPGDVFLLAEGERVAADAVLREAGGLAVDESLLTGESVPVHKQAAVRPQPVVDAARVHAATLVVAGHGMAEVVAIGRHTRVGQIGASLAAIEAVPTPLERQLRRIVRMAGLGAAGLSASLVLWYGVLKGQWLQGLLSAIALGMAMLPEEFPMALAVFLALGAWRLAQVKVLARRPAVIDALGAATVLCVDKTGTLTENRLQLRRLVAADADADLAGGQGAVPVALQPLLAGAVLASRRGGIDPIDRAVLSLGDAALVASGFLHGDWRLARAHALSADLPAMTQVWDGGGQGRHVAAKGAPEAIALLCRLDGEAAARGLQQAQALAAQGLRVIAVAQGVVADGLLPDEPHGHALRWLGLLGFEDPLRPGVAAAVAQARDAGIQVAMITGDHPATALSIAGQAGLDTAAGALTGDDIARLDDAGLARAVATVRVFARVMPQQKLRLVQAFQARGHTVAMTGDGVNDAPALKAAHVGIAMGLRGTDVAREAAGLVLLDDDFAHIVAGVRMGRRIGDNLRTVMTYIVAIHVPIAGLALLPLLMGLPPLLLPVHVVLTEMVIDPMCSLAFEGAPASADVMRRPPRRGSMLIDGTLLRRGLVQGGCLLLATLAAYVLAMHAGRPADEARTLGVVCLTLGDLGLVGINLAAGRGARALLGAGMAVFWAVAAAAAATLVVAIWLPGPRALLHFAVPSMADFAATLAALMAAMAMAAWGARKRGP
jgi:Ca2+-transporting ATPase